MVQKRPSTGRAGGLERLMQQSSESEDGRRHQFFCFEFS